MDWLLFLLAAAVIVVSGTKLSIYADILAIKLGLSRSAIGVLLVSIVTTLPETTTTLGAIRKVGSPNLALGNNFGSILLNLAIIGICDIAFRKGGVLRRINARETKAAFGSLVLILIAGLGLLATVPLEVGGLNVGFSSLLIIVVYVIVFRAIQKDGLLPDGDDADGRAGESRSMPAAVIGFSIFSALIIASGISLAVIGDRIAVSYGLSRSFVGTLFLALATSLPELTVGISSVRRGAYDLMFGNVMGANMLNVVVIALADIFYNQAVLNIPGNLGWGQLFSAGGAAVATLIALSGVAKVTRERQSKFFGWRSVAIILVYLVCLLVVFKVSF